MSDSGQIMKCTFETGQLRTGDVILLCKFSDIHTLRNIRSFQGQTQENHRVLSTDLMIQIPSQEYMGMGSTVQSWAAFPLKKLKIELFQQGEKEACTLRFGLVNLNFIPIEKVSGFPHRVLSFGLNTGTTTYRVILDPIDDYRERIDKIRATKSVDVICEAVVNLQDGQTIEELTQMVGNLCYVLSVARGTQISWIYRDIYSSDGSLLRKLHAARVTKPYTGLPVIDPRDPHETKAFVERAYSAYIHKKDLYRLDSGTIDAYLDAKQESDFLQMRGLKIVVAMEMVVWSVARALGVSEKILCEQEFRQLRSKLRRLIKNDILQGSQMRNKRALVYSKIPELKRRSFKDMLREITSSNNLDLRLSKYEVELFVRCRNSLVHEGDFYCNTAKLRDRQICAPKQSASEEYFLLTNVLDRIFLKILEYQGIYIDCSHDFNRVMFP
ncbi:hypothetical protein J7M02_00725 [Candidatus Aerophobetes bacterium]|nr:hypothetical protein [Candidatus Aerophobetes bacterium]